MSENKVFYGLQVTSILTVQPYVAVVEQTEAEEVPKSSGEAVGMVAAGHPFEDGNLEEDLKRIKNMYVL